MTWDLSRPDWEQRIRAGQSLMPDLPDLNHGAAEKAVRVFDRLRLADVPGNPLLKDAVGDWFRDIVRALHGSWDEQAQERYIREIFALVPKKNSKALALDTLIATPNGFTTMGELAVGDTVFDVTGMPCKVLEKSEMFTGRKCYELEFSTGEMVVCDAEHLWVTDAHLDRERQRRDSRNNPLPTVKTTQQIADTMHFKMNGELCSNHRTLIAGRLYLPEVDLPIPPYALGAWLGDGTTTNASMTSGLKNADNMVATLIAHGQPAYVRARYESKGSATISFGDPIEGAARRASTFRTAANKLGLFGNKHIPQIYLRASFRQRVELLRGLMDTDGCISARGQASYVTTLPVLRDDVRELIASLGFKTTVGGHQPKLEGAKFCAYAHKISFHPEPNLAVATLQYKYERQLAAGVEKRRSIHRQIRAIREVPSVPTQCIAVSSHTKQFLITRSFIPTHNTSNSAGLMLTSLIVNKRPKGKFLLVAPTQDVTELAFGQCEGMVKLDDYLSSIIKVQTHLKRLTHMKTGATLEVMSFDPSVLTGQKPTGFLVDELHVVSSSAKAQSAVGQLRGGMISQPEAFGMFITTQSEKPPSGVFKSELDLARGIRDGKTSGRTLPILYELPRDIASDPEAVKDSRNWYMITPNAGRSITVERLEEEFRGAQARGDVEVARWLTQHVNAQAGLSLASDAWAGASFWEEQADPSLSLASLLERSEVVVGGVDGGGLDDLLALSVIGRDKVTKNWLHWGACWAHEVVLQRRKSEAGRLRDFERDGQLSIVDRMGQAIEEIADKLEEIDGSGLLSSIGFDPFGIGAIVDALAERGIAGPDRVVGVSQGFKMVGAIKTTEVKLADGTFWHCGQPIMAWAAGNAKVEAKGNAVIITKQTAGAAKIDPIMSLFNAVALMSTNPAAKNGKSIYETPQSLLV